MSQYVLCIRFVGILKRKRKVVKTMKFTLSEESYEIEKYIAPIGGCNVHNVLDTKGEPVPDGCSSFLEYWEKESGQACPNECQAADPHLKEDGEPADATDLVGAHVRIDGLYCPNNQSWIVPLCKYCNRDENVSPIYLPEGTVFVPITMAKAHPTAG